MGELLAVHHVDLAGHAGVLDGDHRQPAGALLLDTGAVADDRDPQVEGHQLFDGGDVVDLDDDVEVLDALEVALEIALEEAAGACALGAEDELLALELFQADAAALGKPVLGGDHQAEVVGVQQHRHKGGAVDIPLDDGDVGGKGVQHIINCIYGVGNDINVHVGVAVAVGGDDLGQQVLPHGGGDGDGQVFDVFAAVFERLVGCGGDSPGAAGVFLQNQPFRRQNQLFFVFIEDLNAIFLFQHLNVVADGRLGQGQLFGGGGVAALVDDPQQGVDVGVEHGGCPPLFDN